MKYKTLSIFGIIFSITIFSTSINSCKSNFSLKSSNPAYSNCEDSLSFFNELHNMYTFNVLFENYIEIDHLNLMNQNYAELPEQINCCTSLKMFNLSGSPRINYDSLLLLLVNFSQLTELTISGNDIKQINSCIGQLHKIEHLDLAYNKLTNLPETFSNLKYLNHLDLSYNQFYHLPPFLTKFEKLEYLNLRGNHLSDESISILSKMPHLEHIHLGENNLTEFPYELLKFPNLKRLGIFKNDFVLDLAEFDCSIIQNSDVIIYIDEEKIKNIELIPDCLFNRLK